MASLRTVIQGKIAAAEQVISTAQGELAVLKADLQKLEAKAVSVLEQDVSTIKVWLEGALKHL